MESANTGALAVNLLSTNRPLVIGHRGYCSIAPENTLPSFSLALEAGANLIELDYHHSKDDVPLVIHDDTLDRTTDARKRWRRTRIKVADTTATEIRSLDAGGWFGAKFAGARVPLLTEALDFILTGGGVPLLEHKSGAAATCIRLLSERKLLNKVIVISFDWSHVSEFHEMEPGQLLGALGPPDHLSDGKKPSGISKRLTGGWLDELAKTGAKIVVWNRLVSSHAIQLAHQRGLKVWIYTVDAPKLALQLLDKGVDGIITNRIAVIQKALETWANCPD